MPKRTKDVDFAILEQKLINLEKEYKLKTLKMSERMKTMGIEYNDEDNESIIQEN